MINAIKSVAILGSSGNVGSLTGGLIAQNGIKVYFLSRTLNRAKSGLERAIAQARSEVVSRHIVCGDYDQTLERALEEADWVIEAVSEDLAIKRGMYEKLEKYKRQETIVSTTTSSLPLTRLSEGRSENFKRNFLSTHFYNPPGKMLACEVAVLPDTSPEVFDLVTDFLERELRRVVIPVKNIAGFAGNRIAFVLLNLIAASAEEYGVEVMDYLIGPYTGRLMPPLATLDLVGLDIYKAIIESLHQNTNDETRNSFVLPNYINKMVANGLLGNKTKSGFYRKLESGKYAFIDPVTCNYVPAIEPHVAFVEKAKHLIHMGMYKEAFDTIRVAHSKEADIVMDFLCKYVAYSYSCVGEVTEREFGMDGIDKVMSFGFNWAAPSVIVKMVGGTESAIELLHEKGFQVPRALSTAGEGQLQVHNWGRYFIAR